MQHVFLPFVMHITNTGAAPDPPAALEPAAEPKKAFYMGNKPGNCSHLFQMSSFLRSLFFSNSGYGNILHTETYLESIQKYKTI